MLPFQLWPIIQLDSDSCLPRESVRSYRLRAQSCQLPPNQQMPVASPACHLGFWQISYNRSEVPMTPSSDLINLLDWLSKLREAFYLLDHWCIIKGYNSGTTRWKKCLGQGMGKGCRASVPSPDTNLPACPCAPTWNLSEQSFWGFMAVSSHRLVIKSLAIEDWFNLQLLSPPQWSGGWVWKFQH